MAASTKPVSRAYEATPQQVADAKSHFSFQVALEGSRQRLQRDMCGRVSAASTATEQDRLTDGYWDGIVRAQAVLRRSYPEHGAVLRDLDRNARAFQRGVTWADYQQSCSRYGFSLRRAP